MGRQPQSYRGFVMCENERLTHIFREKWDLDSMNGTVADATRAGANMAEFAIRSISTIAYKNPPILVCGLIPYLGTYLDVDWKYAIGICAAIVAYQAIICTLIFFFYTETPSQEGQEEAE